MPTTIWKTLFDPDFHPALLPRKYYPVRNNLPEVTVTNVNLPEVNINLKYSNWLGIKSKISLFYNKIIHIIEFIKYSSYYSIHFIYRGISFIIDSMNRCLLNYLLQLYFPTNLKLNKYGNY